VNFFFGGGGFNTNFAVENLQLFVGKLQLFPLPYFLTHKASWLLVYTVIVDMHYVVLMLSVAVMKLFIMSMRMQSPAVLECISLPCLRILQHIINPSPPASKKNKVYTC